MRIGHGVDTGAYCAQASCSVAGKSADELTSELAELGAGLLLEVLPGLAAGTVSWTEQDEALVTHAAKIQKAELRLDPAVSAADNERRALASSDAAPARCMLAGKPVRVLAARVAPVSGAVLAAGELAIQGGRVLLGCGEGALEVLELKPDGKRAMDAAAWAAGQRGAAVTWEALS